MASVTNNHSTPLGLPGGVILNPAVPAEVPNWGEVSKNAVVKTWVDRKILTVGEDIPAKDEKDLLQERLDELGVKYDKRSGVEKLRATLAEAEGGTGKIDNGQGGNQEGGEPGNEGQGED